MEWYVSAIIVQVQSSFGFL